MFREFVQGRLGMVRDLFRTRARLIAENVLLRRQVVVLKRAAPRPRLKVRDGWAVAAITRVFPALVPAVTIVRPETVIRWRRSLWRLLWRRRSERPAGRRPVDADTRALIRRMWKENPLWVALSGCLTRRPAGYGVAGPVGSGPLPVACATILARPGLATGSPS
ncbi:MAG: hypothetical protein JXP73_06630 [Deltaproteobacteria bacterium]|jgi:hypothetical protein|nr:hypothetical protein [Deltaproteobacteria bacterium]